MRLPPLRLPPLRAASLLALGVLAPTLPAGELQAADSMRCAAEVDAHLAALPLAQDDLKSIRIIERTNIADDFGPEIFGVDAWARLNSCSGWLVINMRPTCHIVQTYTRGDCRVDGLKSD